MKLSTKSKTLARAVGVVAAVMVVVSGVTFAALQSQQDTLTGNTIETATANLQLSTDGVNYSDSHTGFDFNNLIPGGSPMPVAGYSMYLKNSGGTPLALKLSVNGPVSNPQNVDLFKVHVLLTTVGGDSVQTFNLSSLAETANGLDITGNLPAGASQQYKLQVQMDTDALTGSSASLGNIDLVFKGLAVN